MFLSSSSCIHAVPYVHYDCIVRYLETQSIYLHAAVGKTCLCNKLAGSAIPSDHQPTIGVDFKTIDIEGENENEKAQLQIWDTAGNKQFATMTQSYLGTADFIVLVYSVANKSSLDSLESTWLPIMRKVNQFHVICLRELAVLTH